MIERETAQSIHDQARDLILSQTEPHEINYLFRDMSDFQMRPGKEVLVEYWKSTDDIVANKNLRQTDSLAYFLWTNQEQFGPIPCYGVASLITAEVSSQLRAIHSHHDLADQSSDNTPSNTISKTVKRKLEAVDEPHFPLDFNLRLPGVSLEPVMTDAEAREIDELLSETSAEQTLGHVAMYA